jgi:ACT domain-containing protein
MTRELDADDIARITSAVLAKLGGQAPSPDALSAAVRTATQEAHRAAPAPDPAPAVESATSPAPLPEAVATAHPNRSRIILASFGLNRPGIVASISAVLAENNCSIEDMSQRIMQEFYTLIMIVDIEPSKSDFAAISEKLKEVEQRLGVTVFVQHEDVFRYMHRV